MKIDIQQLNQAKKTAIVDCLRKIGGQRNDAGSYYNYWYLEIAREIEHGELLLARYNYPKQDKEEEPTPPGIEEERQRKGWLDYGTLMGEIGLHRSNAIHRINEHKEQFNQLAVPDLYHVAEYYKAVGSELTCCCLQAHCKDFFFTQDEVKDIIDKDGEQRKEAQP